MDDLPFFDAPAMVCGLDVYHKAGSGNRSILAFTASVNARATQFWSGAKVQDEGQEISNTLEQLMAEALQQFKARNDIYPESIVVYRDGVGDS